ncbi:MAG: NADPH-dependent FMN reductase, partial [Pseudobdellovibrio sp.]
MRKLLIFSVFLSALLLYKISFAANACFPMVHNSQLPANTPEVTVIIGTDRQGSNSAIVSKAILSQLAAQNNVRINLVDLAKLPKSIFKSDYFAKKPAEFTKNFVEPIDQASALVFVIPEYDGAVPGILSYFMNHVRVPLAEKQVALVGLSAGRWGARSALDSFKGTLTHRAARVLGDLQINIENVDAKISEQNITDPETNRRIND